ncbi:phosphate:Na+ symporter [Planifilum fulgidum]|uniref:Phosphate:Na+ symporter n=1 Tax=Planifilum fulgidum TaxID=201973 RepID=A0A1I2KP56_9BACL|nr:phosphate:Na+ symporter [Planifilum fulgidum]
MTDEAPGEGLFSFTRISARFFRPRHACPPRAIYMGEGAVPVKEILIPFATGLAVFLFGMQLIRIGLGILAGDRLESLLLRFTRTPARGMFTGLIVTSLLQSSSAVTVLAIGLVDAGILTFPQTIGIILGTNIGTTVTTEILALKIEDFAVPMLVAGGCLHLLPWKRIKGAGMALAGFGCIFLGMEAMQWLSFPLKERGWIQWFLEQGENPIWTGIAAGTLLTAVIQSSSAAVAMTMGFYSAGLLPLPAAVAIVLGSNVGTCATGLIAATGTGRSAKRVAVAHLLLNVIGVLLFAPAVHWLADAVRLLEGDPAARVAHVQTLFNILCSLIALPFARPFARLVTALVPDGVIVWRISKGRK